MARAHRLAYLGLLPKHYNKKKLGESEKRHIRRLESKINENSPGILRNPEKFLGAKVPAKHARRISDLGFPTYRTKSGYRFFAPSQHAGKLTFNARTGQMVRTFGNRKTISYPFDEAPATIKRVEDFFKNRKKDQYLTFRIGGPGHQFNVAIYSMKDFARYVTQLEESDDGEDSEFPIEHLQIVEVSPNEKPSPKKTRSRKNSRKKK